MQLRDESIPINRILSKVLWKEIASAKYTQFKGRINEAFASREGK
jgi:hypothetical protein